MTSNLVTKLVTKFIIMILLISITYLYLHIMYYKCIAPSSQPWISRRRRMDGWLSNLMLYDYLLVFAYFLKSPCPTVLPRCLVSVRINSVFSPNVLFHS